MATIDRTTVLRPGLLRGVGVLIAAGSGSGSSLAPGSESDAGSVPAGAGCFAGAAREVYAGLGARVSSCAPHATEELPVDEAVRAAVAATGGIDQLVLDGPSLFTNATAHVIATAEAAVGAGADARGGGHEALRACLDTAWNITRATINHAFLPGGRGGRIVYVAPTPAAGEFAEVARAGLENLSRTLSVEWARHGVGVVCIAPGPSTTAGEVANICAYLASPAGAYFSGCQLDLRGM